MSEFWDIAKEFTGLTSRDITYGNKERYEVFKAIAFKIGHPIEKEGCLICVKDALTQLKKEYKQHLIMSNSSEGGKTIKIKGNRDLFFEGGRYNSETLTDEIALRMLKKHPEYEKFLIIPKQPVAKAEEVKETEDTKDEKPKTVKRPAKKKVVNESN